MFESVRFRSALPHCRAGHNVVISIRFIRTIIIDFQWVKCPWRGSLKKPDFSLWTRPSLRLSPTKECVFTQEEAMGQRQRAEAQTVQINIFR